MNESSLDYRSDEEDEEVEPWDVHHKRHVTTWQTSTSTATRPPRTFAARKHKRTSRPSARKALDLGSASSSGGTGPMSTAAIAEQSHRALPDHTSITTPKPSKPPRQSSRNNNNKPKYSSTPPWTPSTPINNISSGNRDDLNGENTPNFSSSSQFFPSNSSSSLSAMSMSIPTNKPPRASRNSSSGDVPMSPHSPLDVPNLERTTTSSRSISMTMTRSNTLPPLPTHGNANHNAAAMATLSQPPKGHKPPRFRRAFSLALGTPSSTRGRTSMGGSSSLLDNDDEEDDDVDNVESSADLRFLVQGLGDRLPPPKSPQEIEAELMQQQQQGGSRRKKPRAHRRNSMQGTLADLKEASASLSSPVVPHHHPPLPPQRPFSSSLPSSKSTPLVPPTTTTATRSLSEAALMVRDHSSSSIVVVGGSPSASSRASSGRKRGYCGSPAGSDQMDDLSIGAMSSSMNSSSSRRRIVCTSNFPGSLEPPLVAPLLTDPTRQQLRGKRSFQPDECRGMDASFEDDDDSDEDALGHDSDHDTAKSLCHQHDKNDMSMEDDEDPYHHPPIHDPTAGDDIDNPTTTAGGVIFQTMSSYEDLKFLIKQLRKHSKQQQRKPTSKHQQQHYHIFGVKNWLVTPPNDWDGARRLAFFKWTTGQFGFAVRHINNSVSALSISSARGEVLLKELDEALVSYKEETTMLETKDNDPEKSGDNDRSALSPFVGSGNTSEVKQPMAVARPVKQLNRLDSDTSGAAMADELVAGLQTLTMQEPPPVSSTSRPSDVSLQVGGDFVETIVATDRPSFDPSVVRPSFENSLMGTTDMMMHMHGHSPEKEEEEASEVNTSSLRPPKLSMASIASNCSRGRPSAPHAPIQNLEVIETPQIKQDEGWGSRPVEGKDWGVSLPCEESILEQLTDRFEEAVRVAKPREESMGGESYSGLPVMPGGLDLEDDDDDGFEVLDDPQEDVLMMEEEEEDVDDERELAKGGKKARRLKMSFAKHQRVSMYAAGLQDTILPGSRSVFRQRATLRHSLGAVGEAPVRSLHEYEDSFPIREASLCETKDESKINPLSAAEEVATDESILVPILSYLTENEMFKASLVSTSWAGAVTTAHASLMMASVGYMDAGDDGDSNNEEETGDDLSSAERPSVSVSMDRDWGYLNRLFPWACFLSSGAFKRVFRVFNSAVQAEEAVSVMDVQAITDKKTIAAELVVTSMLSAMSRRGICPNFVVMHGVFTMPFDVPESIWGTETNKKPKGAKYNPKSKGGRGRGPRQPKEAFPGRYQFIRMELCDGGDMEEHLKRQKDERLHREVARSSLFQIAFALHAAAVRVSLKHYDIKLLNVFVQGIDVETPNVVLRYGLGSHVFALDLSCESAFFAKLADYGTANVQPESTNLPVTIAQFTTLENTPPDYLILGDEATQGHGHDNFGLGLCMLHLFTGHAPYEEILEDVVCPPMLKKKLRAIWENEKAAYSVLRSVILADVYKDERGHIIEGEPDETLYDTLYRFLVLFGIPTDGDRFDQRKCPLVWKAISDALEGKTTTAGRRQKQGTDVTQFERDSAKYSIHWGSNCYIARARKSLEAMEGGMELLLNLCSFNPHTRATSLQVLNSPFMEELREKPATRYGRNDTVFSYTSFSTS